MKLSAMALLLATIISFSAHADDKMKMNFKDEDITKVIEQYSKAAGKKFIIDSTVRGKVTILNPTEVSLEEAYNQISTALALNGFAILKQDDNFVIRNARSAQRDNVEVVNEVPTMKPERMVTWVIALKNVSADDVQSQIRILTSSYGEIVASSKTNQLIITDWTPNLQRVAEIVKKLDVVVDPATLKIVTQAKKERMERMARKDQGPKDMKAPHMMPPKEEKETN
ncbi:MAG: general secretion pathway protein GspD [Bdellovibrio sp.]|nr:general secretion pathway protein GspD [Bdellovibrio sp.]